MASNAVSACVSLPDVSSDEVDFALRKRWVFGTIWGAGRRSGRNDSEAFPGVRQWIVFFDVEIPLMIQFLFHIRDG